MTKRKHSQAIAGLDDESESNSKAAAAEPSSARDMALEDLVRLSVGGQTFVTRWRTLCSQNPLEPNFFDGLFEMRHDKKTTSAQNDDRNAYDVFIDRSPDVFAVILDYLRTGLLTVPPSLTRRRINAEFAYYSIKYAPHPDNFDECYYMQRVEPHRPLLEKMAKAVLAGFKEHVDLDFGGVFVVFDGTNVGKTDYPTAEQVGAACKVGLVCEREPAEIEDDPSVVPIAHVIDTNMANFLSDLQPHLKTNRHRKLFIEFVEREYDLKIRMKARHAIAPLEAVVEPFVRVHHDLQDSWDCCVIATGPPPNSTWQLLHGTKKADPFGAIGAHFFVPGVIIHYDKPGWVGLPPEAVASHEYGDPYTFL